MFFRYLNDCNCLKDFKKCSSLWRKNTWPKPSEIIETIIGCSLVIPVVTRWNSLFDAVCRILRHERSLQALCKALEISKFSSSDLTYLKDFRKLMTPISETLDFLQGEKHLLYGCLIPSLVSLKVKLKKLAQEKNNCLRGVAEAMDLKLKERFNSLFILTPDSEYAITATVLSPDIKMRWFNTWNKGEPKHNEQYIYNLVIRLVETITVVDTDSCNILESDTKKVFYEFDDEIESQIENNTNDESFHSSRIAQQFFQYLNDPESGGDIWKKYPLLKRAYLHYNTPLT